MRKSRTVSVTLLVAACLVIVAVGAASTGKGPGPATDLPAQAQADQTQAVGFPAASTSTQEDEIRAALTAINNRLTELAGQGPLQFPAGRTVAGPSCPGAENVENLHVRVGPPSPVSSEAAPEPALQQELVDKILASIATVPPPPCPSP
jgi:hypothetical protein